MKYYANKFYHAITEPELKLKIEKESEKCGISEEKLLRESEYKEITAELYFKLR